MFTMCHMVLVCGQSVVSHNSKQWDAKICNNNYVSVEQRGSSLMCFFRLQALYLRLFDSQTEPQSFKLMFNVTTEIWSYDPVNQMNAVCHSYRSKWTRTSLKIENVNSAANQQFGLFPVELKLKLTFLFRLFLCCSPFTLLRFILVCRLGWNAA